jgi:hypothetical protein
MCVCLYVAFVCVMCWGVYATLLGFCELLTGVIAFGRYL